MPAAPAKDKFSTWEDIVKPPFVGCILGKVRVGKSATAYWLAENIARKYGLSPKVVNLPEEDWHLLPDEWGKITLDEVFESPDSVIIIDEGTTQLPAGSKKLADLVKAFLSARGKLNQVVLLIFHASSDVDARILRGVDGILLKRPSKRQIDYGSKDRWMKGLLTKAKTGFDTLNKSGQEIRGYVYVDTEDPEFEGFLKSGVCSFWSEELSKTLAGIAPKKPSVAQEKTIDDYMRAFEEQSPIEEGEGLECCICHEKVNKLISGTCQDCFKGWVISTIEQPLQV